ncbi:hypothetical protein [Candidatus Thiosymbion oneisti]|uniref:hypothetical protein n=1 Tax=Candidatus Thiosymbion oneisti TaxID=589554 RepID=UPI000B7DDB89|nr:hypothetical protein [Candidatus Thiosymbion oneisti]
MSNATQGPLEGRFVLFVDDRPDDVYTYIDRLRKLGADVRNERSIGRARRYLDTHPGQVHLLVIDLFFDLYSSDDLGRLDTLYGNRVERNAMNQGQLLGEHAKESKPSIPYLYLTNEADSYTGDRNEQPKRLFTKHPRDLEPFLNQARKLLDAVQVEEVQ